MSKGDVIYVKGMKYSDSDGDDAEDIWDDRKLNEAYDKAVRIAQVEVAKRVAMATNTQPEDKEGDRTKNKKDKSKSTASKVQWKVGTPCRAVYVYDGLEYEAVISRIISDEECVVKFLGYGNSEIVRNNTLRHSFGKEEQTRQIEQALSENADDGFASQSPNGEKMDFSSDRVPSPGGTDQSFNRKKKSPKKKAKKSMNGFEFPDLPFMPHMNMLRNLGNVELPLPPPPPMSLPMTDRTDSEEQAMSSMLLSWYMSGYYTGLYQGMKRAKESRKSS